jgi:hypothetical protein
VADANRELKLVSEEQAADMLGLRKQTLSKHRWLGIGVRHVKLGRRVLYRLEDLHAWVDAHTRQSTSER